ncbi:hypothetical protein HPB47_019460 [Ixodes persulcatus]|uniref:Uncharacterized protein n=1 Tax=Ixodes persulcatus TaxID=34615 RepID=A0AC60QI74_IXOPE|nr:hypothetical protein HPB47_019460 [Ixodes persulcatus]
MGTYSSRTGNCKSVRQVLRHVVSFKHQGEQARPGEQATPQELAKPEPPELFLMPLSNMEQFRAAEAQLKNFTNRTLPEEQLVSLGDSKKLQKVVREMVGRLFSKQVQEQFSLLGYRGKSRFKDAMMCNVVIGAIQSRAQGCSVDAMEKRLTGREAGRGNIVKKTDTPLVVPTAFDDEGHSG